jgi:hypothetical protein
MEGEEKNRVVIPESILSTAVFPRVFELLRIRGPGSCKKKREIGCTFMQISHRFRKVILQKAPKCMELGCDNPALHICSSGVSICCQHCFRFGWHHVGSGVFGCICTTHILPVGYCLRVPRPLGHVFGSHLREDIMGPGSYDITHYIQMMRAYLEEIDKWITDNQERPSQKHKRPKLIVDFSRQ